MIEQVSSVLPAPQAAAGRGRGARGLVVALASDAHGHEWRRLPDAVGLFFCARHGCQWFAVCPACLGSLDVALRLRDGIAGLALYWCAAHGNAVEDVP